MAVHLIVDGYNVIRSAGRYAELSGGDMADGREALIEDLRRYKRIRGFPITVIFDGQEGFESAVGAESYKGIRVLFSRSESADELIVRKVRQGPAGVVLVSSDRELIDRCHRLGASVVSSGEFEDRMELAQTADVKGESLEEEDQEDGYPDVSTSKKGPSRRSGKRRRKDRKRLNRL